MLLYLFGSSLCFCINVYVDKTVEIFNDFELFSGLVWSFSMSGKRPNSFQSVTADALNTNQSLTS